MRLSAKSILREQSYDVLSDINAGSFDHANPL